MPSWLMPEAKREWNRITPELSRLGLLSKLDRARLASYCQTWAIYVRAAKIMRDAPLAVPGDRGREMKKAPEWTAYQQAASLMESALAKLGLTPADRLRMQMPEVEDEDAESILD
jgi:P27 family predicted phage terminase small subunit